jgi:hypothetical protein
LPVIHALSGGRPNLAANGEPDSLKEEATMLIIGLLLLVAVALVASAAIAGGGGAIDFDVVNNTIQSTGAGTFLIGAATGAALVIGIWLVWLGTRHTYARRREFSRLRRAERTQRTDAVRDRYRAWTRGGAKKREEQEPESSRPKDEELVSP